MDENQWYLEYDCMWYMNIISLDRVIICQHQNILWDLMGFLSLSFFVSWRQLKLFIELNFVVDCNWVMVVLFGLNSRFIPTIFSMFRGLKLGPFWFVEEVGNILLKVSSLYYSSSSMPFAISITFKYYLSFSSNKFFKKLIWVRSSSLLGLSSTLSLTSLRQLS